MKHLANELNSRESDEAEPAWDLRFTGDGMVVWAVSCEPVSYRNF
jgi:hypothetical protein